MKTVLFINSTVPNCGIYQFGKRVYEIIKDSEKIQYIYKEPQSLNEYMELLITIKPDFVLLNWYSTVMGWLPFTHRVPSRIPHYYIFHERPVRKYYDKYLFFGDYGIQNGFIDSNNILIQDKCVILPRPLFSYTNNYPKNDIPTIGTFGFMSDWRKGFDTLTEKINKEFDKAVFNLHMVWSPFCDPTHSMLYKMSDICRNLNVNPNVKLNITHELFDNNTMLDFLAKNDINVFLYNDLPQFGLASSIDYALSVKRPIAIDDNNSFRHVLKDEINIKKHSIKEIMDSGIKPLEEFYGKWSSEILRKEMDSLFYV